MGLGFRSFRGCSKLSGGFRGFWGFQRFQGFRVFRVSGRIKMKPTGSGLGLKAQHVGLTV